MMCELEFTKGNRDINSVKKTKRLVDKLIQCIKLNIEARGDPK